MTDKVRTNVYLGRDLKEKAKELFREYGLSLSYALNIFLAQVVRKREFPLEEAIPKETMKVIKEARKGKNMGRFTVEELKKLVDETAGSS